MSGLDGYALFSQGRERIYHVRLRVAPTLGECTPCGIISEADVINPLPTGGSLFRKSRRKSDVRRADCADCHASNTLRRFLRGGVTCCHCGQCSLCRSTSRVPTPGPDME